MEFPVHKWAGWELGSRLLLFSWVFGTEFLFKTRIDIKGQAFDIHTVCVLLYYWYSANSQWDPSNKINVTSFSTNELPLFFRNKTTHMHKPVRMLYSCSEVWIDWRIKGSLLLLLLGHMRLQTNLRATSTLRVLGAITRLNISVQLEGGRVG